MPSEPPSNADAAGAQVIRALLLDLDDTLLQSNFERFLPAYMGRLASALEDLGPADHVIAQLISSTGSMIENLDPTRTLKHAFDGRFYPALNTTEPELRPRIDRFYKETYPELRGLTAPAPDASELIEKVKDAGVEMVVATNPLFPATAIRQRLAWAGLPVDQAPFTFITSYEHFHFAKPQPEYYAEILGLLGVQGVAAAIIGDDVENDLEPAAMLGISGYHVSQQPDPGFDGGDLAGAWDWLQQIGDTEEDVHSGQPPRALLARLRGYLGALLQQVEDLTAEAWVSRPSQNEWAPVEVVCHLRDTEVEVYQPRLRRLLMESSPFLSAANPDQWAEERRYLRQDPLAAVEAFKAARQETIAQLASLDAEQWRNPGRHAILGPTTLAEQMSVAVDHDLIHLAQLRDCLYPSPS
ncbi:MAG: DinB family protein [Anaerolineales bacterium]